MPDHRQAYASYIFCVRPRLVEQCKYLIFIILNDLCLLPEASTLVERLRIRRRKEACLVGGSTVSACVGADKKF